MHLGFALKTRMVFLEALKKDFVHLSSKLTFSAKKLKHMKNLSSALQKTVHFIRDKNVMYLSFALKIALNFFLLRKKFLSICGLAFSEFA